MGGSWPLFVTQRRGVAKSVGCFLRHLFVCVFVCLFVNTITSERVKNDFKFGGHGPRLRTPTKMWRLDTTLGKSAQAV